jgi:hypothetical protein
MQIKQVFVARRRNSDGRPLMVESVATLVLVVPLASCSIGALRTSARAMSTNQATNQRVSSQVTAGLTSQVTGEPETPSRKRATRDT